MKSNRQQLPPVVTFHNLGVCVCVMVNILVILVILQTNFKIYQMWIQ